MKIKAYFLFPETDEEFLKIGDDPNSYKSLIEEVRIIKFQLKTHNNFELCYDSANLNMFLSKAEILIGGKYLASCRVQLNHLFGNYTRNLNTPFLRDVECIYVHWNINRNIEDSNTFFSELAESKLVEGQDKTILINISNAFHSDRDSVHIIKDAKQYNELPLLINIPIANNEIEFSQWYTSLLTPNFSLQDKSRFRVTTYIWVKQKIYIEITTTNYWYYDYYHKENIRHYEVFNNQGVHLGEANINGVLNSAKADKNKRIDHIIR